MPKRRRDYSLFYFETVSGNRGSRTHLRFTRLGVIVIILLVVVPLVLVFILFQVMSREVKDVNPNVFVPVNASTPRQTDRPILERPTTPVLKTPEIRRGTEPPNPLREKPAVNSNQSPQITPSATPSGSNRSSNGGQGNQ